MKINTSDEAKKKPRDVRAENFLRRYEYEATVTNTGCAKPRKEIKWFDFRVSK